jgi:ABC-type multidrug transport system fused ATPase/permease subunit
MIQDTLTTQFQDTTVLVIAHRTSTLAGTDRIVTIDQGKIARVEATARNIATVESK